MNDIPLMLTNQSIEMNEQGHIMSAQEALEEAISNLRLLGQYVPPEDANRAILGRTVRKYTSVLRTIQPDIRDTERLDWLLVRANCDSIEAMERAPFGLTLDAHLAFLRSAIDTAIAQRAGK